MTSRGLGGFLISSEGTYARPTDEPMPSVAFCAALNFFHCEAVERSGLMASRTCSGYRPFEAAPPARSAACVVKASSCSGVNSPMRDSVWMPRRHVETMGAARAFRPVGETEVSFWVQLRVWKKAHGNDIPCRAAMLLTIMAKWGSVVVWGGCCGPSCVGTIFGAFGKLDGSLRRRVG